MSEQKLMPQKDRTALKSVIKQRYEILGQQLTHRREEVQSQIRTEIESRYEDAIAEAVTETENFRKQADKLEAEVETFVTKMRAKVDALVEDGKTFQTEMEAKGIALPTSHYDQTVVGDNFADYIYSIVHHSRGGVSTSKIIELNNGWKPTDLDKRVRQAYGQIAQQAGLHKLDLKMQELELTEELLVGGITSEEGRDFMTKIPTIDSLLPAPETVQAIEA